MPSQADNVARKQQRMDTKAGVEACDPVEEVVEEVVEAEVATDTVADDAATDPVLGE